MKEKHLITIILLMVFALLIGGALVLCRDAHAQSGLRPDDVRVDSAGDGTNVVNPRKVVLQEGSNITLSVDATGDTVIIAGGAGTGFNWYDSAGHGPDSVIFADTAIVADTTIGGAARAETAKGADTANTATLADHATLADSTDGGAIRAETAKGADTANICTLADSAIAGDNLGNHTATENLNLGGFDIDSDTSVYLELGGAPGYEFGLSRKKTATDSSVALEFQTPSFQIIHKWNWWGVDMDFDSTRFVPNNLYASGHSGMIILNGSTDIHGNDWWGIKAYPGIGGNWVMVGPSWAGTTGMCLVDSSENGFLRWAYPDTITGGAVRATTSAEADSADGGAIRSETSKVADSAKATTHQSIQRWDLDSTAMPFVFSSAYKGSWASADSEFATIETIEDSMALAGRKAGQVWTGVHDFGGATSTEIVNGANPTTDADGEIAYDSDDEMIEVFDGTASRCIPTVHRFEFTIDNPDGITDDTMLIADIDATQYPGGIKILEFRVATRQASSYSVTFLELTTPIAHTADCDTVATSSSTEATSSGAGIYDADIAAGNWLAMKVPATDIDQLHVKVLYYVKEFN